MTAELAGAAITNAAALRDMAFAGVIVHTDRGSQFRSRKFLSTLKDLDMVGTEQHKRLESVQIVRSHVRRLLRNLVVAPIPGCGWGRVRTRR